MMIDIALLVFLVMAVIKGLQRGIIVAIFSLVGLVVGIAAALKFSVLVAGWLEGSVNISSRWLPAISFLLVFVVVVLLIRLMANLVEASVELALLGWVNKIGGALLYIIIYTLSFSVILFYLVQLKLISEKTIAESVTYTYVKPWGPVVINGFGKMIPLFKDMFAELENFFGKLVQKNKTLSCDICLKTVILAIN
jgi:membrane protein required for colicin V production